MKHLISALIIFGFMQSAAAKQVIDDLQVCSSSVLPDPRFGTFAVCMFGPDCEQVIPLGEQVTAALNSNLPAGKEFCLRGSHVDKKYYIYKVEIRNIK